MSETPPAPPSTPSSRRLLLGALPALVIGAVSAFALWLLEHASSAAEAWMWSVVPASLGFDGDSWWWILLVLTITGALVGLVVWLAPGHGGFDSATVELMAPVLPLKALPGVALVIFFALAGGVSLGPESPIIAINTALAVALLARFVPGLPQQLVATMAASATIGAMFGTPVAAALLLTGLLAAQGQGSLWDKLFLPVAAAGAGAATMIFLGVAPLSLHLPQYDNPSPLDLVTGSLVALFAAGVAIIAVLIFPATHRLFHRLRHPLIYVTLGGLTLGVLGAIGGPITLFKGVTEMGELVESIDSLTVVALLVIIGIKVLALVVSASSGFRGGRIFPAVFLGVAIGILGHLVIPILPLALAVACGVLGMVLVVGRDGWLALFIATAVTGQIETLPMLCIVVLPVWLVARKAPEMIVHVPAETEPATR